MNAADLLCCIDVRLPVSTTIGHPQAVKIHKN